MGISHPTWEMGRLGNQKAGWFLSCFGSEIRMEADYHQQLMDKSDLFEIYISPQSDGLDLPAKLE